MNAFLVSYLERIIPVSFCLQTEGDSQVVGEGKPEFTVTLKKPLDKAELITSTSLALGEAYMRGELEVDRDLYEVLDLFLGHMDRFTTRRSALRQLYRTSAGRKNQKKQVSSHYDLGNDFYRLWLDETMNYSCAYFREKEEGGEMDLYQAQIDKTDHILQKLQLKEGMRLLDIGCGWGFLILRAAEKYGVKALGITLSEEQYRGCRERIRRKGLEELVEVRLMDYRDLETSNLVFDRIVSVGMLEHVGRGQYELFLQNAQAVLKDGGLFLLHFISALAEHPGDAWIKKYIFPGGVVPSLREIISLMPEYRFYTLDVESLRRHYMKTLLCWRQNFLACRSQIENSRGAEFARMWELYLSACAATFHNGVIDLHQVLLSKGANNELPMLRVV